MHYAASTGGQAARTAGGGLSLRFKIPAAMALCSAAVGAAAVIAAYPGVRSHAIASRCGALRDSLHREVAKLSTELEGMAHLARALAIALSGGRVSQRMIDELAPALIARDPRMFGMCVAFVEREPAPGVDELTYYCRRGAAIVKVPADPSYEHRQFEWFAAPWERDGEWWTSPYFDKGLGDVAMITFSTPIRGADGAFIGVATFDYFTTTLSQRIAETRFGDRGYTMLLDRGNCVVAHPDPGFAMGYRDGEEVSRPFADVLGSDANRALLRVLGDKQDLLQEHANQVECDSTSGTLLLTVADLGATGMRVVGVTRRDELLAPANAMLRDALAAAGTALIASIALAVALATRMATPFPRLVRLARAVAQGEPVSARGPRRRDEIGQLETALHEMAARLDERNAALKAHQDHLEQLVDERTRALTEARDLAEAASRAKSDFLANMSHEIRTPMSAILGFSDILLNPRSEGAERQAAAETIRRNGEHLLQVINDILDLSKIEAGKLEIERGSCGLLELMAGVFSALQLEAEKRRSVLSIEFVGAAPAFICTDALRLRQILMNIIGNACKFTENGQIRVVCQMARGAGGRALLVVDVHDTGVGIGPQDARGLFRPFAQADETMTRRFGGTGLGLNISQRLAWMLGGDVKLVHSEPGVGSHFRASVEADPTAPEPEWIQHPNLALLPAAASDARAAAGTQALLGLRVLLAEDGPDNRRLLSRYLRDAGAAVRTRENGRLAVDEAIDRAGVGEPYDLILMDMQMPVLDGYSATRELRARGYRGAILALTAHAMSGDRRKCLDAGCDGYLTKPVARAALVSGILECVSVRAVRSVAAPASAGELIDRSVGGV